MSRCLHDPHGRWYGYMSGDSSCDCASGRIEQLIRHAVFASGASGIVIGISGGIDSAVAAALCCRALPADRVLGLFLPTRVTREMDRDDAADLCTRLGMPFREISMEPVLSACRDILGCDVSPRVNGNLIARTRMTFLYFYANQENRLVCGTSNRTEYLLGYCTKYGDSAADLQPLLHLYKTEIRVLAREIRVPEQIIQKIPSAGLWEGQEDEKEIGLAYDRIDAALIRLAGAGWKASDPDETLVMARVEAASHKRLPPPNLLALREREEESGADSFKQ